MYVSIVYYYTFSFFFFFNDTATTEIYTLSLHDALPIFLVIEATTVALILIVCVVILFKLATGTAPNGNTLDLDRKSTRLNSSHANISYAVFCLKKKNKQILTFACSLRNK